MRRLGSLLLSACLAFAALPAAAQDKYPSKPVRILVPYAPGGATDIVSRVLGEQLRNILGQPFVTENKPGAFGIVAIEEMARARPDGHTLMVGNNSTNAVTPVVFAKKLHFDYERDVQPIARLAEVPSFLLVPKDFPAKNVGELVAYAKQNPGKLRYGTVGIGSYPHYDMEMFVRRAGIEVNHIPIKSGAAGLLKELVTGDVQVGSINVATSLPMLKGGQVRALAVSSPQRLPDYPELPTMAELGFGEASTIQWLALFASAAVPSDIVEKLYKASVEALRAPATQDILKKNIMLAAPSASPAEAKAWLREELAKWRRVTAEVKIETAE